MPLQGGGVSAAIGGGSGEAQLISAAGTALPGVRGGGTRDMLMADAAPATDAPNVANSNAGSADFNVGIDTKGFAVPMTPKQLHKARDYQDSVRTSEAQVANASNDFERQFGEIARTMYTSPGSAAFLNDLKMRYQYAQNYDQQGDHNSARAFLSDCKQDTDNLKRIAKADHNKEAVAQLDILKQTVNELDDVEKHFKKRPTVVLANANTDQIGYS
jgi:hypothetical protein